MTFVSRRTALSSIAGAIAVPSVSFAVTGVTAGTNSFRVAAPPLALQRPFYASRLVSAPARDSALMLARFFNVGLVARTLDGRLGPALSTAWHPDPDPTRWVFDLVPGLTPQHLLPYLEWLSGPNGPYRRSLLYPLYPQVHSLVRRWTAINDRQLAVDLHFSHPDFPRVVSDPFWAIPPRRRPAGRFPTGPYSFVDDNRDPTGTSGTMTFEPAPNGYLSSSRTKPPGFAVVFVESVRERLRAVASGEMHLALGLSSLSVRDVEWARSSGVTFVSTVPESVTAFEIRFPSDPGAQAALAQALKALVPRQRLSQHLAPYASHVASDAPLGLFPFSGFPEPAPDPGAVAIVRRFSPYIVQSGVRYAIPEHAPLADALAFLLGTWVSRPVRGVHDPALLRRVERPLLSLRAWPRLPEPFVQSLALAEPRLGGFSVTPPRAFSDAARLVMQARTMHERSRALASFGGVLSDFIPAVVPFVASSVSALAPGLHLPAPAPSPAHVLCHDRLIAGLLSSPPFAG